jgi:hypothetical protein
MYAFTARCYGIVQDIVSGTSDCEDVVALIYTELLDIDGRIFPNLISADSRAYVPSRIYVS